MKRILEFIKRDRVVMQYNSRKEVKELMILCSIAMLASLLMSITNLKQHSWAMLGFTGASTFIMLLAILAGAKWKKSLPLNPRFALWW